MLKFLTADDKRLNKNLATSFTSTLPSVLFPAIQMASLLLDAISKSFYYYRKFIMQYHHIINLNGFLNHKQYRQTAPLKMLNLQKFTKQGVNQSVDKL